MAKKRSNKRKRRKKRSRQRQEHDPSYKGLFSTVRMVRDLLLGFLTGPWLKTLDFSTLELAPASYVGRRNRQRHNDIVWRLKSSHSGDWVYVYLMLEFQSTAYKFMAVRVLTYLGLFYETLIRQDESVREKGARLPAVIPIVIYNGKPRWGWPRKLSELLAPFPEEFREYQPECSFVLLDEGSFEDQDLAARVKNFVALLFRLENARHEVDFAEKFRLLDEELEESGSPELAQVFERWLNRVAKPRFPSMDFGELRPERKTMLAESIREWAETRREEGRQEGRRAMQDMILGQIEQRFGTVPGAVVSKIRTLTSEARLQQVAREIIVVRSLDELELA